MSTRKILLKSSDNRFYKVDEAVALQWRPVFHLLQDCDPTNTQVHIANVSGDILKLVIKYCKKHAEVVSSEDLKNWDAEFVSELDQSKIFNLIHASNYLDIPSLLDLTCQTTADRIAACRDEKEIRQKFEIVNDFTPDEQEKNRRENQWCFQ